MAQFAAAVTTDAGIKLMADLLEGEQLEFTKLATGSGEYATGEMERHSLQKASALKNKKQEFGFSALERPTESCVLLKTLLTNADLGEGYRITEIGIYARKRGTEGDGILYSLSVAEEADYLPPYNGMAAVEIIEEYYISVSDSAEIIMQADRGAPALAEEFEKFKEEVNISLSGEQKPTIPATPPTRQNINNGDTLGTIIAKIIRWLADIKNVAFSGSYNDLSNKPSALKNPKAIKINGKTYDGATEIDAGTLGIAYGGTGATDAAAARANLQAAAHNHNHSTDQITSGTLPVARGGTGGTDAATARSNLGAAAFSHSHSTANITTGTLPIARGGTGAADAGTARSNLQLGAASTQGIANNLTTTASGYVLDARQGTNLKNDVSTIIGTYLGSNKISFDGTNFYATSASGVKKKLGSMPPNMYLWTLSPVDIKSIMPDIYNRMTAADFIAGSTGAKADMNSRSGETGGGSSTGQCWVSYDGGSGQLTFGGYSVKNNHGGYDNLWSRVSNAGTVFCVWRGTVAGATQ